MTPTALANCTARINDLTFGVEIECTGVSTRALIDAIATVPGCRLNTFGDAVLDSSGRRWNVVRDASIRSHNGFNGGEVVTPILQGNDDLALLQRVIDAIAAAGAVSSSQFQCGVHVHIGAKHLKPKALGRLAAQVESADDFIRTAVKVASERHRWCAKLDKSIATRLARQTTITGIARAWYGSTREANAASDYHYHSSRYVGINLHSFFYRNRRTVEFRYFNGTLNSQDIADYVTFCRWMVARAEFCSSFGLERPARTRSEAKAYLSALGLKDREFSARFTREFPAALPAAPVAAAA